MLDSFQICVHFECLPMDENTLTVSPANVSASADKPKSGGLRQSASADQPIYAQAEESPAAHPSSHTGRLLAPPGESGKKHSNINNDRRPSPSRFQIEEGHSSIHWSSDSDDSDDDVTELLCEQLRTVGGNPSAGAESVPPSDRELKKGSFAQSSFPSSTTGGGSGRGRMNRFYFPGKRRGSMPNDS